MKHLFILALFSAFSLQATLSAQGGNEPSHGMEVRVQASPEQPVKPQAVERTLSIIKPDAVKNQHIGNVISRFEDKGLRIAGIKMVKLNKEEAGQFYKAHRERPFFPDLVEFMSSGPIVVIVLEGNNAIAKNREIMGVTDPKKAAPGTIRADLAQSMSQNAVHGSDSPQAAAEEISFFFEPDEIYES